MKYPFELQPLPYDYNALQPQISELTLNIHHLRNAKTYVTNLNMILENHKELQNLTLEELLTNPLKIQESIRQSVLNNAGGVYNHQLYFNNLSPKITVPDFNFLNELKNQFNSFDAFKKLMLTIALQRFGSGYAWLVVDDKGVLEVISTANQDCPLTFGKTPLLVIDVWEHAYFMQYMNVRIDYLNSIFNKINWQVVSERYKVAIATLY